MMISLKYYLLSKGLQHFSRRTVSYVQGQSPSHKMREYFYFIDHQGMPQTHTHPPHAAEKAFLEFFFKRIRPNDTGRYQDDFPYWSPCGRERNFLRCDDRPIVLTHLCREEASDEQQQYRLLYGHSGDALWVPFDPARLYMSPETGRVYHPGPEAGCRGVALVRSKLAVQLSEHFGWSTDKNELPDRFTWQGRVYPLTNEIDRLLREEPSRFRGMFHQQSNTEEPTA